MPRHGVGPPVLASAAEAGAVRATALRPMLRAAAVAAATRMELCVRLMAFLQFTGRGVVATGAVGVLADSMLSPGSKAPSDGARGGGRAVGRVGSGRTPVVLQQ